MDIDVARSSDAQQIAGLVNDAFRGASQSPGWTHETTLIAGQRIDSAAVGALIDKRDSTILVMRHGRDISGCVALQRLDDTQWYLSMLAVDPARQADGLGKSMMASAEKFAQERGAVRMKISVVNRRESLLAWYERQGYRRTGAIEPFPYGDPTVGTPLCDDLALIILAKELHQANSRDML
jgi:ribosomal protein S18 acetylase RimI-like enzyme